MIKYKCPACDYCYILDYNGDEIALPLDDDSGNDDDNERLCNHCDNVHSFSEYWEDGEYD